MSLGAILRLIAAGTLLALLLAVPAEARPPHPLFADDDPIRLTIRGPLGAIRRAAPRSTDAQDASLELHGSVVETHQIRLAARGISRRQRDLCAFPPLRVEFTQPPGTTSLFRGQRRLKLVTHCRAAESFQQHVLLEYAAYRLLNALTPRSLRVRLALIDYVEADAAAPLTTRLGFFVEDVDDAARRNGLVELDTGNVRMAQLAARDAGRYAVFQYLIGNLDWAMHAGPQGAACCHNSKLLGAARDSVTGLVPVPYDFDHSGLVDAPYATPPPQLRVPSVRVRRYRGHCIHNAEAQAAAAEVSAARDALLALLRGMPRLDERTRNRALAYLSEAFVDIRTSEDVSRNLLSTCLR